MKFAKLLTPIYVSLYINKTNKKYINNAKYRHLLQYVQQEKKRKMSALTREKLKILEIKVRETRSTPINGFF